MKHTLELCIDSVISGMNAQEAGANRVELCDNLYEGGTTPSIGMIRMLREKLSIDINIIIRPRGGDFLYSESDFNIMKHDIVQSGKEGVNGVVFGILMSNGHIDIERTKELVELARPMSVTFHRAFDMTPEPFNALDDIISTGADRLLTSGQQNSVLDGMDLIKNLINYAEERIIIMPGAGINKNNIAEVVKKTEATEYHLTGRRKIKSKMEFRKEGVFMGGLSEIPEYTRRIADIKKIRKIRDILDTFEY